MTTTLVTAPSTEPVTLDEVKAHIRVDSSTFSGSTASTQSIFPGSHATAASYTLLGTSVDVLGKRAIVYLVSGTNGTSGTVDVKIQESDDNSVWTDVTSGAFTQVTTANDNATYEKEYTGSKQYIRVVSTVAVAACEFGVDIVTDAGATTEDDLLNALIKTVRKYAEEITGRAFITQTWDYYMDTFTSNQFDLPKPKLSSITSIVYTDKDDTATTLSSANYYVDTDALPGRVVLKNGQSWPTFQARPYNPIKTRFVCGYGTASDVPEPIKQWILMAVGWLYENREKGLSQYPVDLLMPYRVWT